MIRRYITLILPVTVNTFVHNLCEYDGSCGDCSPEGGGKIGWLHEIKPRPEKG